MGLFTHSESKSKTKSKKPILIKFKLHKKLLIINYNT